MADVRVSPDAQLRAFNAGSGNIDGLNIVQGDAQPNTGLLAIVPMAFDGTNYDRLRTTEALTTTPTSKSGLLAVGLVGWDGYQTQMATVRLINSEPTVMTHDYYVRRALQELLDVFENTIEVNINQPDNFGVGYKIYSVISLASTNGALIHAGATKLQGYYLFNTSASTKYVKFYDKVTSPTVGTDTPVMRLPLPAGSGANVDFADAVDFVSGLGIGITGALADNDTTALTAGDVVVNVFYN